MYTEEEAKEKLLDFINSKRTGEPPFEVTDCRISERKDYWILGANVIEPYPKYGGAYGYLVDNSTGEIIICGSDQHPDAYIQDKYDLEGSGDSVYVLVCGLSNTKVDILLLKKVFELNYSQAILLVREQRQWYAGKKRHLQRVQELLAKVAVPTSIELTKEVDALVDVTKVYGWEYEPIEALNERLNIIG